MGTQTRMSVQKRERERKKAEKAAMKRERRQQRKDIDPLALIAETAEDPNNFDTAPPNAISPEPAAPEPITVL